MSEPLVFRWADPGEPSGKVAGFSNPASVEVLADIVTVRWRGSDGSVVWTGKLEDPGDAR